MYFISDGVLVGDGQVNQVVILGKIRICGRLNKEGRRAAAPAGQRVTGDMCLRDQRQMDLDTEREAESKGIGQSGEGGLHVEVTWIGINLGSVSFQRCPNPF